MILTQHAVERYQKRHYTGSDPAQLELELREIAGQAVTTKERSLHGDEIMAARGVRFVVRRDGPKAEPVCVTILPALLNDDRTRLKKAKDALRVVQKKCEDARAAYLAAAKRHDAMCRERTVHRKVVTELQERLRAAKPAQNGGAT